MHGHICITVKHFEMASYLEFVDEVEVGLSHTIEGEPGVLDIELLAHGENDVGVEDRTRFSVDGFGDKEES